MGCGVKVSAREIWENTNPQPIAACPSMTPVTPADTITSHGGCRLDGGQLDGLQRPPDRKPISERKRLKCEGVSRCIQGHMVNVNNQPTIEVLTGQAFRAWDQDGDSVSHGQGRGCCREGSGRRGQTGAFTRPKPQLESPELCTTRIRYDFLGKH